jgi:hypothetical protein
MNERAYSAAYANTATPMTGSKAGDAVLDIGVAAGLSYLPAGIVQQVKMAKEAVKAIRTVNGYYNTGFTKAKEVGSVDWKNWSKGGNISKAHLNEYATIEQRAKQNGSWLKNADGSTFQGDPRTWVQMQSESFNKWKAHFGDKSSVPKIAYHGTANKFKEDMFYTPDHPNYVRRDGTKTGESGVFFTPDKSAAEKTYTRPSLRSLEKGKEPMVYEMHLSSNNAELSRFIKQHPDDVNGLREYLVAKGKAPDEIQQLLSRSKMNGNLMDIVKLSEFSTPTNAFRKLLSDNGYNGYSWKFSAHYPEKIIFDAKQAMAISGNKCNFSAIDTNFYKVMFPVGIGVATQVQK